MTNYRKNRLSLPALMAKHVGQGEGWGLLLPFRSLLLLGVVSSSLLLAGCAKGGKISAFSQQPPDEFAVASNPPLTIPPGDAMLPVPLDSAAADAAKIDPADRGLQTIFGEGNDSPQNIASKQLADTGLTAGDIDLLTAAGAIKPNADIRQLVNGGKSAKAVLTELSQYKASLFSKDSAANDGQKSALDSAQVKKDLARPGAILVN